MSDSPILSVRNAARHYRSGETVVRALDGVSFDIHPGEVVGILGPSGSGKSTLLLIAGLLEPPTTGEIYIRDRLVSEPGADLDSLRDFRRNNIGFVFQKANLIPFLTAVENVALALEIDDVPAHAARLLDGERIAHRSRLRSARTTRERYQVMNTAMTANSTVAIAAA